MFLDGAVGSYLHNAPPNTPSTQGAEEDIKGHPGDQHRRAAGGHWKVCTMSWTPLLLLPLLTHCPGSRTFRERPSGGPLCPPSSCLTRVCCHFRGQFSGCGDSGALTDRVPRRDSHSHLRFQHGSGHQWSLSTLVLAEVRPGPQDADLRYKQ